MKIIDYHKVRTEPFKIKGAKHTDVRWLISHQDKAKNFSMRIFEMEKEGYSPYHEHNWEHEIYVLEGIGEIKLEGEKYPIKKGSVVFVEPNQKHSFKNIGDRILKYLMIDPIK